jgi:hypothetical protein
MSACCVSWSAAEKFAQPGCIGQTQIREQLHTRVNALALDPPCGAKTGAGLCA